MATSITIGKWKICGTNHQELLGLKKEIFYEERYLVNFTKLNPVILDGGAHVGLAAFYFKSQWPQADITCVEPLPENIHYLKQNLWENRLDDVKVIEAALAEQKGERSLYFDKTEDEWFSTAGFYEHAWNGEQQSQFIRVPTISLKTLVTRPTDLVKLDLEGAETTVLSAAGDVFPLIHHLIFEYHPHPKNDWHQLMRNLKKHHFISTSPIPPNNPTWLRTYHFINSHFQ